MYQNTINVIRKYSTFKPTNLESLVSALKKHEDITFYSWECPPRQIQSTQKNGRWVNFDIDIKSVVNGKKIDMYTELPRLTTQPEKEKWFIQNIVKKINHAKYIKLIADTNAKYLFSKSLNILGEQKILILSQKFKLELKKKSKSQLKSLSPDIYLYSDYQKKYLKDYEAFFDLIYTSFDNENSVVVPSIILKAWQECMLNHIGFDSQKDYRQSLDVMKRAISSYAAEGMLFQLFRRFGEMPNPVWINWEEQPGLAETTQILRNRYSIEPSPIIYFF